MREAYLGQHLRDVLVGHERPLAEDRFDLHEVQRLPGDQLVGQPVDQLLLLGEDALAAVELFDDDLGLLLVCELRDARLLCRSSR